MTSLLPSHTTDAYSMWGSMWALKNSSLASMSTTYLNFGRQKARLETVSHTLTEYESEWSSLVIPKTRCSDTWSISAPRRTRWSGMGDCWCFCPVAIVIDLVLIRLVTVWLNQLDTWSKVSWILFLIDRVYFPDYAVCVICQHVTIKIYFACLMEVINKKRLKNRSQDRTLWWTKLYWIFRKVRAME